MRIGEIVKSLDWILIGAALLLIGINLAMLFSSTSDGQLTTSRFFRQLVAVGISLCVGFLVARLPYHHMRGLTPILYGLGLGGLFIVFLIGDVIRGTASRLEFAGFQIQPSEFMKIALVMALAWFFARWPRPNWHTIIGSGILAAVPIALIVLEPDIGVAALLAFVWSAELVFIGLSWWRTLLLGGIGIAGAFAGWEWVLAPYQRDRLLVFLDPARDPLGAGYNVLQSIVAIGSGRFIGRGLGHGPQSQLQFLPERHTDFILASIGEELGFIGITVVILLYAILLWRILKIAKTTRDPFGRLLAIGTFLVLLISFTVSVGMNMGLLPVTGIPLPLVSYGGSNLLSTFVLLGIVESVHVYSKWVQAPPVEISHFD